MQVKECLYIQDEVQTTPWIASNLFCTQFKCQNCININDAFRKLEYARQHILQSSTFYSSANISRLTTSLASNIS